MAVPAHAGDKTVPGEFIVEPPTLRCLGFEWLIKGDDNRNGKVDVSYRQKGDHEWMEALPLLRIQHEVVYRRQPANTFRCGNMYAGSILFLEPDTEYETRFVLNDPDGGNAERTVTVRTRAVPRAFGRGKKLHVYPTDSKGKKEAPAFSSILAAYDAVHPGDVILIHAGTYQERFVFSKSGTPEKPIVLRGAGDGESVLLGSGREFMIDVHEADHLFFENLTIRDPGTGDGAYKSRGGVAIYGGAVDHGNPGCRGLVVRRCRFEDIGTGILASDGACRDFYIADNVFIGRNPTWERLKSELRSGVGIWIGGQGHVVCHNRVANFWDGIDITAGGSHPMSEGRGREYRICAIDFHNNDISNCMDDFIETDHGSHNIRVWENRCMNSSASGISAQPVFGGPAYFIRNVIYNVMIYGHRKKRWSSILSGFKLNCGPAGLLLYHNTVSGATTHDWYWSNSHFRNNLFMAPFNGGSHTRYSSLDYNGYMPQTGRPLCSWRRLKNPHLLKEFETCKTRAEAVKKEKEIEDRILEGVSCATLEEMHEKLGYEKHGRLVDYGVFVKAAAPFCDKAYGLGWQEHLALVARSIAAGKKIPAYRRTYIAGDLDLRLKPGSAAVDAGVRLPNINDGHAGKAPDLGAYELGRELPVYGPRRVD